MTIIIQHGRTYNKKKINKCCILVNRNRKKKHSTNICKVYIPTALVCLQKYIRAIILFSILLVYLQKTHWTLYV